MVYLFYTRLIALTAGTLVYLFLIALILGHRRPRLFERLLFFLVLALFLIYAGGLLEINAAMQYGAAPQATRVFYALLTSLGFAFLPALLVHVHLVYMGSIRGLPLPRLCGGPTVWFLYALPVIYAAVIRAIDHSVLHPQPRLVFSLWGKGGSEVLGVTVLACSALEYVIVRHSNDRTERKLFACLCGLSILIFISLAWKDGLVTTASLQVDGALTLLVLLCILPGALLIYFALKHNFLEYGAQRNLVYALAATFLALLYLALVHRISGWLAPVFPPEATASVLLFALIFLFEPLERVIGPVLHERLRERMDRTQRLSVELQTEARQGNLARFLARTEELLRQEFGLAVIRISIPRDRALKPLEGPGGLGHSVRILLSKDGHEIGLLEAATTGAVLTGETTAALQFLAEQIPALAELCRLIEEKLRLERELAERERMAMLGQMAASVSHNLRNPLSSIKTILQVQLENRDLPVEVRHDCALVLDEINRMNLKVGQLLKFARPAAGGERAEAVALAQKTVALFRHDAQRQNVIVEFEAPDEKIGVLASEEALGEVLSNLVVNALEAQPERGRVRLSLAQKGDRLEICVEDQGPGISAEMRARIFQPFFTTKATGTGLGLAIVARRVDEMGGTIACESPLENGKGSRFRVTLPRAALEVAAPRLAHNL